MISERINHEASDGYLIPVASAEPVQTAIPIHWLGDTPTIDTRVLAEGFDNRHKNVLALTRKYRPLIESQLGPIIEETLRQGESAHNPPNLSLPVKRSTKPQTIFLLTEEQALFLGALCRNSERVVSFKMTLIKSFAEERRRKARTMPAIDIARLNAYEQRLIDLEQQLSHLLHAQQQAAQLLLGVDRSTEAMPEETVRMKIQRIVNGYCHATSQLQQDVWRRVYERLNNRYGVRIRSYNKSERESWLDVADRTGHLGKIYAIVSAELRY